MKVRDSISIVLVALGLGLLFGPGLGQERPLAIATTSLLADFAETVGGDRIEVYTITPSGICPAHYDIKPSDVRAVAQASLVLYHGIEPWLDDLITASGNGDVERVGRPRR
ncbi:MAG: metal ABC transporter substrate-binding protein, partial [Candidatus Bipolaricaulia bacterium]